MEPKVRSKGQEQIILMIVSSSSLAMVGLFHTILGTALPAMRLSFKIDLTQAGLIGSAAWFGFTTAVFVGGVLSDILKRQQILMLACFLIGISALLFGIWQTFPVNGFIIAILGVGTGAIVSSSSALVMTLHPKRGGWIMNLHHFFYALGAITGPLVMGFILKQGWPWQWVYRASGIIMLGLSGSFLSLKWTSPQSESILDYRSFSHLLKEKGLILLILISLFGIGTQNGISFWLVSFLKEVRLFPIFYAGLGFSLFSIGMAVGRLLSGWLVIHFGHTRVLLMLFIILNFTLLTLLSIHSSSGILAACFMAGMACSGLFPGLLALGGTHFPRWSGTTMGILGTAAGIGSTLTPWLISILSKATSLRTGFFILLLTSLLGLGTLIGAQKRFHDS
jgi:MFS family permease